jgi:uncharacterized membrane protein YedE/YeeE
MDPGPPPPTAASRRTVRLSKAQKIGGGLLLTLAGLFLLSALFPTAPEKLAYVLPVAAVGILALWTGGILMGIGSRS